MPPKDRIIEPINATLDEVTNLIAQPAGIKLSKNKELLNKSALQPATPPQYILDLGIEVQRDVNGVEMGVLENGIPFLTQRGLAILSGAPRSVVQDITQDWERRYDDPVLGKDRNSFLKEYLFRNGYRERKLYIETRKDGSPHYAYPDIVCMAILEYYAFEAKSPNAEAKTNYRRLAAYGLQKFIYDALNYIPADKWKYHTDRVSLLKNSAPDGYWIIYNEVSGLIVDLITASLTVNEKTIPDISVGIHWGAYWKENNLAEKYGPRIDYSHNYPSYYPQSQSNPQTPKAYPDAAIPEFRRWFRHVYLPTKFPKYILTKANILPGGKGEALAIGGMYQPKQIEGGT